MQQKQSGGIEQFGYKPEFDRTLKRFASFRDRLLVHIDHDRHLHDLRLGAHIVRSARHLDLAIW